jgi:hypothetical protein
MHTNKEVDQMLQSGNLMELDPYGLEGVRDLADMCGIPLSDEASSAEVQEKLFPVWGTERAFTENAPKVAAALKLDGQAVPSQEALSALRATRTLDRIPTRNYRDGFGPTGSVILVSRGAVANWMERGVREGQRGVDFGLQPAAVFLIASNRLCDKPDSEVENPFVRVFHEQNGRYPSEAELLPIIVRHVTGYERRVEVNAPSQADQVKQLIELHPEIANGRVYIPTNANATYVPLQIRRVIREQYGSFDGDSSQFWFSQDWFPLATTPEEAANPYQYQRPLTVFSGLVRLINELCLLQGR